MFEQSQDLLNPTESGDYFSNERIEGGAGDLSGMQRYDATGHPLTGCGAGGTRHGLRLQEIGVPLSCDDVEASASLGNS